MLADLRRAGLKMTPQRIALVQLFATDESHPTAQTLYERLRPAFPSMSFATVYNTLDALARAGLSSTLRLGQVARFDPNTKPHHHAVCDVCGEVRDVPADDPPHPADLRLPSPSAEATHATSEARKAKARFHVRAVERIYRGTCAKCAQAASGTTQNRGASAASGQHR
jgi:Fe2+ or Zn2+ uptake regulation protein